MSTQPRLSAVLESIFDLSYLIFVIGAGAYLLFTGAASMPRTLYGVMALVLGIGDAFHLLPRVRAQMSGRPEVFTKALGLGKLITSITMTAFYIILYAVWTQYYTIPTSTPLTTLLLSLAAVRIVLCLCPQNRWFSREQPLRWAVYRNLPFLAIGILIAALFGFAETPGSPFKFLPLAVALSFAFYIPVVLLSQRFPAAGALMLPKTLLYIWIVCMGGAL